MMLLTAILSSSADFPALTLLSVILGSFLVVHGQALLPVLARLHGLMRRWLMMLRMAIWSSSEELVAPVAFSLLSEIIGSLSGAHGPALGLVEALLHEVMCQWPII